MKSLRHYTVKDIEAAAWNLLNKLYGSFIPIPIDIEYLLEVHPCVADFDLVKGLQLKYGIAGVVFRFKEDCYSILVDSDIADRSPYFYRFTIAEELSHLVLHRDLINEIDTLGKAVKLLSDPRYKNMDRNAKRFAAALLMPNKIVIRDSEVLYHNIFLKDRSKTKETILAEIIDALRKKYDVSRKTMTYRLNEWPLNIIDRVTFSLEKRSEELLIIE